MNGRGYCAEAYPCDQLPTITLSFFTFFTYINLANAMGKWQLNLRANYL